MKKLIILLTLLVVILGINSGVSANPACFAVEGGIDQDLTSPPGTISGDIEGWITVDAGPIEAPGGVWFRPIVQTWEITGGTVDPLIGTTVVLEGEFRGIWGQVPPLLIINNTLRVAEGADKANITEHGWTNVNTLTNHLDYHGVICP